MVIYEMMIYVAGDESYSAPTLPPVYNTWLTLQPDWFKTPPVVTTPSTTTTSPNYPDTRNRWYYEDDLGRFQGPFSSRRMEFWETEGYFRLVIDVIVIYISSFNVQIVYYFLSQIGQVYCCAEKLMINIKV